MNEKKSYRLGEYLITEIDNVLISWERHAAVAEQLSGKCFIHGNVLIIGNCSHQETGYLIGEFIGQLEKLPVWNKTRYFCLASSLLDTGTAQKLTNDFLEKHLSSVNTSSTDLKPAVILESGTFRLGQYRITVSADGDVYWQTYEGLNKIAGGRCIIESALLFIGSREYEKEGQSKQEFLSKLAQLPQWDKTMAWSHSEVLRLCRQEQQPEKQSEAISSRVTRDNISVWDNRPVKEKSPVISDNYHAETFKKLLPSALNRLKSAWHRMHEGKVFPRYLMPVLIVILLLGLAIAFFSIEEISDWSHRHKEHHHKHDDREDDKD